MAIREGTKIQWNWGDGTATGKVIETFHDDVETTIAGNTVRRNASQDEPAYLIEQEGGSRVLKSTTEVRRVDES